MSQPLSLALAGLLVCSLIALSSGQETPVLGWIVAGNNQAPTCSFCLNALGAPDNNTDWSGLPVGIYRCVKFGPNELWAIDYVNNSISLIGPGNQTLCIDAGSQPDYTGRNVTYNPMYLRPCDASPRQQWFYNSTNYLRSGLKDADGSALYMVQGELGTLTDSFRNTTPAYYNLYLSTEAAFASTRGFVNAQFTFNPASDYTPLSARISDGGDSGNLVRNGGFESSTVLDRWPPWQDCTPPTICARIVFYPEELFSLCSWRVVSAPDWLNNLEPYWKAAQGNSSLLLSYGASINQIIPTRPNSEYVVSFSLAGLLSRNAAKSGSYQLCTGSRVYVSVQVDSVSAILFELKDNETSQEGQDTKWSNKSMRFVAAGSATLLTIESSGAKFPCGPVIDDVRVSLYQPTAEGSSDSKRNILSTVVGLSLAAIAVLASLLVGGLVWRRRQKSRQPPFVVTGESEAAHNVKSFSYSEIQRATSNWSTILGKGGFSTVYKGEFPDGVTGAVKVENNKDILETSLFREELAVLLRVNHRFLVNLIGYCTVRDHPILVFEYLPNGTLYQRLHTDKPPGMGILSWQARMKIVFQISCALEYLHHGTSPPIVHRDIKSANILLTATDSAKLADFGLSKSAPADASAFHTVKTDVKGSLGYLDPKYVRSGVYSVKSDVYSYGVLLLELISGHTAIKDLDLLTHWAARYINDPLITHEMVDSRVGEESWSSTDLNLLVNVVKICVQHDPHQRPTMEQVVFLLVDSKFSGCPPSTPLAVPDAIKTRFEGLPCKTTSASSTTYSSSSSGFSPSLETVTAR